MLYWQRDKKLEEDLEQAIQRFKIRFNSDPFQILVNKTEVDEFLPVKGSLNIKADKFMGKGYFGLL